MTKLYDIENWPKLGLSEKNYHLIGTVNAALKIGRVLDVAGQKFTIHILCPNEGTAGVRRLDSKIDISPEPKEFESHIICPYCGTVDIDSFERDEEDTTECNVCGGLIHYQRIVTVKYTTEPVKPPKMIRAQWVRGD